MNITEKIIQYLSGEMDQEEARQFEQLLSSDPEMEEEFRSVSRIWEITRKNLLLEDLPEEKIRDQLIAEVIAQQDIEYYGTEDENDQEKNFRLALQKAEQMYDQEQARKSGRKRRPNYTAMLLAAASIALLVVITWPQTSLQEKAIDLQRSSETELSSQHGFKTRSNEAKGLQFFRDGDYSAAKAYFKLSEENTKKDPAAQLFYALACWKTGEQDSAVSLLSDLMLSDSSTVSYQAKWYLSLLWIEKEQTGQAIPLLIELSRTEGSYRKESTKLLRKIE